jgi:hypothetical protein
MIDGRYKLRWYLQNLLNHKDQPSIEPQLKSIFQTIPESSAYDVPAGCPAAPATNSCCSYGDVHFELQQESHLFQKEHTQEASGSLLCRSNLTNNK